MKRLVYGCLGMLSAVAPLSAVSISLTYQDPGDPFFTAQAKTTLQKAADDVSAVITSSLAALSQDVYSGTNGSTTANADWALTYTDPTDGSTTVTLNTFSFLADEVDLFVGSRTLGGSTLGVGGPGGSGLNLGASGFGAEWPGAIAAMESASNASMPRGGPILNTSSGNFVFDSSDGFYDLDLGYTLGAIAFDDASTWHFDYGTLPGAGENDFYSVALHEILHTLGFGSGKTFDAEVSGTDWDGSAVIDLLGSGTNVLDADQSHIRNGLTGNPFIDGAFDTNINQEAAMDPSLTVGARKYITTLDLAFLEDMGWEVVPEPGSAILLGASALFFAAFRRRRAKRILLPRP